MTALRSLMELPRSGRRHVPTPSVGTGKHDIISNPIDKVMSNQTILEARGIFKSYHKNRIEVPVLRGVDVSVAAGVVTALVGRSGSGKSTLMHLLATLDQPDQGEIHFRGNRIDNASRGERDAYRNHEIGIIFQFYHLLPELSAVENVMAPTMIGRGILALLANSQRNAPSSRSDARSRWTAAPCDS